MKSTLLASYKLLNLAAGSSKQQIREQFTKLSKALHPDAISAQRKVTQADNDKFAQILSAYKLLSSTDPETLKASGVNPTTNASSTSNQKEPPKSSNQYTNTQNTNRTHHTYREPPKSQPNNGFQYAGWKHAAYGMHGEQFKNTDWRSEEKHENWERKRDKKEEKRERKQQDKKCKCCGRKF